jgi:hypothetical protein
MRKLFAVAAALFASGAVPAAAQPIGVGTMSQGTLGYGLGAALAKLIADQAKLDARVQPSAGTSAYLPLINAGELDFGLANVFEAKEAANGENAFAGRRQQNLRVVGVLVPFRSAFFVRKESGLKSVADLKGKRITMGFANQVSLKVLVDGYLANAGLKASDVTAVPVPNVVRGADEFIAGKTDAAFFAVGAAKVQEAGAAVGGVRYLQSFDTPEGVAALKKILPEAYIETLQPRPGLVGVDEPTRVMAYDYLLLTGRHVKDEVVEKVVALMHANKAAMVSLHPAYRDFHPERMARKQPVEFHPGAQAAYKKLNMWPPKE